MDGYTNTLSWYAKNFKSYALKSNKNTKIDKKQLESFANLLKPDALVLDAGSGSGRDSNIFKQMGFNVIGVDITPELVQHSKETYPDIDFRVGDITELDFSNNQFDGIWAHASVVHFDKIADVKKSLEEFQRVLKQKGILHLLVRACDDGLVFNRKSDSIAKNARTFCEFDENIITKMLTSSGFSLNYIERYSESELDPKKRPEDSIEWLLINATKP